MPDLDETLPDSIAKAAAHGVAALQVTRTAERTPAPAATPPAGISLVATEAPPRPAARTVTVLGIETEAPRRAVAGVLALLAEVEAQTGPRLEIALIRAQLVPPADAATRGELAHQLTAAWPGSLAARVATARLALPSSELATVRGALAALVADDGAVAWALRGRWQCARCGHRPGAFSWRCGQCRRWNTLHMETGVEPPPAPPRERRAAPRAARPDALLGAAPDESLPGPTIDSGISEAELATAGVRRSLLGRVGSWVSGAWRRNPSP